MSARKLLIAFLTTLIVGLVPGVALADTGNVTIEVTYGQTEARSMLSDINSFRKSSEAWYWNESNTQKVYVSGLGNLTYDYNLEKIAMKRAEEIALRYLKGHVRANGQEWNTVDSLYPGSWGTRAENIAAGQKTAEDVFVAWREDDDPYDGQGHRRSMLSKNVNAVGIGHVIYDGRHYWVQEFGYASSPNTSQTTANNSTAKVEVEVDKGSASNIKLAATPDFYAINKGASIDIPTITASADFNGHSGLTSSCPLIASVTSWESSNSSIARVSGGKIYGVSEGSATITAYADILGTRKTQIEVIVGANLHYAAVQLDKDKFTYSGSANKPTPTVTYGGKTLTKGTDYTVSYRNNVDAGTGIARIEGKGSYAGTSKEIEFTIEPLWITGSNASDFKYSFYSVNYDGTEHVPTVTFNVSGRAVIQDKDFTASLTDNVYPGKSSSVEIEGIGNYRGGFALSPGITINKTNLSRAVVAVTPKSYTYDGEAKKPKVSVKVNGNELPETDYTVSYSDNTSAGTAKVTISAASDYVTGQNNSATFSIEQAQISNNDVKLSQTEYVYDGTAKTPTCKVVHDGKTLSQGTDYIISYASNTNAGTAKATVTGKGNYKGTVAKEFTISKANLTDASVSAVSAQTYTGSAFTPVPTITLNGKKLAKDKDFSLSYEQNVVAGVAIIRIAPASNNFTGSKTATFKINEADIKNTTIASVPNQLYQSGNAITPSPAIAFNGKTLKESVDYTLDYSDNSEEGIATILIRGIKNFKGEVTRTFNIVKEIDFTKASVEALSNQTYNGKAKTPAVTVKYNGQTLVKGKDYSVSYKNNVNVGTATVTIAGISPYKGTITKIFKINAATPHVNYRVHRQTYGWEKDWKKDGQSSGTTGQSKRLEGIYINLDKGGLSGSIQYRVHVQTYGWAKKAGKPGTGWVNEGKMAGTTGESKRLEAIQIKLTGEMAKQYDIYYRVHAQKFGWMGWAKNGASAGTAGYSYRLEAIQIKLVKKGGKAPGSTANAFRQKK